MSSSNKEKEKKIPAKRGRKPKSTYNIDDTKIENSLSDDENILVKLDITDKNNNPSPYNKKDEEYCTLENFNDNIIQKPVKKKAIKKVVKLLDDFKEKNKNNEWPLNTNICCYWCCHTFENAPIGIPIKYNASTDEFQLYGCFCSFECASAYNFKDQNNVDELWERNSLLNFMYKKINKKENNIIKPAPDRLTLKMFGGQFSIEEFRKYTNGDKVINIIFPPMTSMTQQIEELNDHEVDENKYIPFDKDDKSNILIYKRDKPLIDSKNSIETLLKVHDDNDYEDNTDNDIDEDEDD